MENSRKGQNLRSVALFLAVLIITPLLILGCSCAKTAQNNTVYRDSAHTSVRLDSVNQRQIHWQDTRQHDSVFKQDSVLVYIKGDTVIKERWHNLTTTRWKTTTKTDTIVGDTYVCSGGAVDYSVDGTMYWNRNGRGQQTRVFVLK